MSSAYYEPCFWVFLCEFCFHSKDKLNWSPVSSLLFGLMRLAPLVASGSNSPLRFIQDIGIDGFLVCQM
jgi:hypothetical protein